MIYQIKPVPKPRMTKRDRWSKRPEVLRYWAFCDECRLKGVQLPEHGVHVIFHLPMPKSWSDKKKRSLVGSPHRQKPDWDNLAKALCDAVYGEDCGIYDMRVSKFWAWEGAIEIREAPLAAPH